jgi:hypothetical protein
VKKARWARIVGRWIVFNAHSLVLKRALFLTDCSRLRVKLLLFVLEAPDKLAPVFLKLFPKAHGPPP